MLSHSHPALGLLTICLLLPCHFVLAQYGALDPSFDPGIGALEAGGNHTVYNSLLLDDNRFYICGSFTEYNGAVRRGIARGMPDGSADPGFDPGLGGGTFNLPTIHAMAVQPDGKIIIVGNFSQWNGVAVGRIVRLLADGSPDPAFAPFLGANNLIFDVALLPDGKILIAGAFTTYNGSVRNRIARLNEDGSLDNDFDPGNGSGGTTPTILHMNVQTDGRILITGYFESFNGTTRNRIARLLSNGQLDMSFNPGSGTNGTIHSASLQADGKLIIGGGFTTYNGTARARLARVNPNGSLDTDFVVGTGSDNVVFGILVRNDGRILIGGDMLSYNGVAANQLVGLLADGSLDPSFDAGVGTTFSGDRTVNGFAEQQDGRILVHGGFFGYGGEARRGLVRILSCTLPMVGTVTVDPGSACNGENVTLTMSDGDLNEASEWLWYANSCSGEVIGTGTTIEVVAEAGTTYQVRGEGGCIGNCTVVGPFVNEPDATVILDGAELIAVQDGAQYQWLDCSTGNDVLGATEQYFSPISNGSYAVVISVGECSAVSECAAVMTVGASEQDHQAQLLLFPNPLTTDARIIAPDNCIGESFTLRDGLGRTVYEGRFTSPTSHLDLGTLAPGCYLLVPDRSGLFAPMRLVKS